MPKILSLKEEKATAGTSKNGTNNIKPINNQKETPKTVLIPLPSNK